MTLLPAPTTSVAIALASIAIVLGTVYVDVKNLSPGDIAAAHAQEPKLTGPDSCIVCHGDSTGSMTLACLSCHTEIDQHMNGQIGFHGTIEAGLVTDCARCHSDHHGEKFLMTNDRSFSLAGVTDPHDFKHEKLDFTLAGKHTTAGCESCHPNASIDVLRAGESRFIGLDQSCTSCHQDVHEGTSGADCNSCHGQLHPFPRVAEFEHTQAFALVGSHGKAACSQCHDPESLKGAATLISASPQSDLDSIHVRSCIECHQSPHDESFLVSVSQKLGSAIEHSCDHCHPAVHESFVEASASFDVSLHDCTGFSLRAPHDRLDCQSCHHDIGQTKADIASFRAAYPERHPDDCRACHGDPHRGQFEQGRFRGADCLECHQRHAFVPSAFTKEHHADTQFPLLGAHARVECAKCHVLSVGNFFGRLEALVSDRDKQSPPADAELVPTRVFTGTSTSCKDCHEDPHKGQFEDGPFRGKDCRECHDEHDFHQSTFTIQQHSLTGFALTGAHAAVACKTCHRLPSGDQASGENTARVFRPTPSDCAACHDDIHQGRFGDLSLPQQIDGRTGCARCHTTDNFQQIAVDNFDHALWTDYELRGAHLRATCSDCHKRSPDSTVHSFGQLKNHNCQTCHSDPHVGQFGSTAKADCTKCHVEGDSFRALVFDHDKHSQFKLDRDHAKLKCDACHKPYQLNNGLTVIRYKPLGTECADCHQPLGPRASKRRGRR